MQQKIDIEVRFKDEKTWSSDFVQSNALGMELTFSSSWNFSNIRAMCNRKDSSP